MPTEREILVRNLRLDELADPEVGLPEQVFPVDVEVVMARTPSKDGHLLDGAGDKVGRPKYPFAVRMPAETPYINATTVYFYNPVEFPKSGEPTWTFEDFGARLAEVERLIEEADPTGPDRLYFKSLRVCEVPDKHAFLDREGHRSIQTSAYSERIQVGIAEFRQRPRVEDKRVRDELGGSVPGNVIKPLKLTGIDLVHLKEHRGSAATTAARTKTRYFTQGQAEQYNDPSLGPKELPALSWPAVKEYFPRLSSTDFVDLIEFDGERASEEKFVETRARVVTPR